jgi:hypothetical protein
MGAVPVVVANLIVAGAALYSSLRSRKALGGEPAERIQEQSLPVVVAPVAEERQSGIA